MKVTITTGTSSIGNRVLRQLLALPAIISITAPT